MASGDGGHAGHVALEEGPERAGNEWPKSDGRSGGEAEAAAESKQAQPALVGVDGYVRLWRQRRASRGTAQHRQLLVKRS